jgi:mannose-6-phosphate isomerase-like protein (cupin superfamily)
MPHHLEPSAEKPMGQTMKFSVSHLGESRFESDGLRPFFEYRDLGIRDATKGNVLAHVIRARPGVPANPQKHHHVVDFQMVYVLKGWIEFEYEGVGKVTLKAGTCVHQPPGIKHTELGHSDDLELIEIVMPSDFQTVDD